VQRRRRWNLATYRAASKAGSMGASRVTMFQSAAFIG
jgi:hypothetical protein